MTDVPQRRETGVSLPYLNLRRSADTLHSLTAAVPVAAVPAVRALLAGLSAELQVLATVDDRREAIELGSTVWLAELEELPLALAEKLEASPAFEGACEALAHERSVPVGTVSAHWKKQIDRAKLLRRERRYSRVWELVRFGKSNAEIAADLRISSRHVARIMKAMRGDESNAAFAFKQSAEEG